MPFKFMSCTGHPTNKYLSNYINLEFVSEDLRAPYGFSVLRQCVFNTLSKTVSGSSQHNTRKMAIVQLPTTKPPIIDVIVLEGFPDK